MSAPDQELDLRQIASLLQRHEKLLGEVLKRLPASSLAPDMHETLTVDELQVMLGCDSRSATYRAAKKLGLRPYERGKYRRKTVVERIARRSHEANQKEAA